MALSRLRPPAAAAAGDGVSSAAQDLRTKSRGVSTGGGAVRTAPPPGAGPGFRPRRRKFGDNWVLEAIFYIRLMPGFIDPTMFKSSDFGRFERRELRQRSVLALCGSSERFRTQLY